MTLMPMMTIMTLMAMMTLMPLMERHTGADAAPSLVPPPAYEN